MRLYAFVFDVTKSNFKFAGVIKQYYKCEVANRISTSKFDCNTHRFSTHAVCFGRSYGVSLCLVENTMCFHCSDQSVNTA